MTRKKAYFFVPNLIVLKSEDGDRHVFEDESAMRKFCEFCFAVDKALAHDMLPHTLWAHNNARFDGMFFWQGFSCMMSCDPSLIMDGASLVQIKFKKVVF